MVEKFENKDAKNGNFINQMEFRKKSNIKSMETPLKKIILPESDEKLLELCNVATYRSSGSGGQHVNTTDSAVRLTFRPYHIVVTSQKERSQYLNKMHCIKKLREKVDQLNYRRPKRIPTKLSFNKKQEGLNKKKKHGEKKKLRGKEYGKMD